MGVGTSTVDNENWRKRPITAPKVVPLLLAEACGQNIVWTEPRDVDVSQVPLGVNLPGSQPLASHGLVSSRHTMLDAAGANTLFADGHGEFISNDVDPDVLRALVTAGAGDEVEGF